MRKGNGKMSVRRTVKIREVEIENFKNVKNGKVTFIKGDGENENIIAMYGQNGSGKTTFVNALEMLKMYLSDMASFMPFRNPKASFFSDFITVEEKTFSMRVLFDILDKDKPHQVEYKVNFERTGLQSFRITKELIKCIGEIDQYIEYSASMGYKFPKSAGDTALQFQAINTVLSQSQGMQCSYFFNASIMNILLRMFKHELITKSLCALRDFARMDMFIITNKDYGVINMQAQLPLIFRTCEIRKDTTQGPSEFVTSGGMPIDLIMQSKLPMAMFKQLQKVFSEINQILPKIVSDAKIGMIESKCILPDGSEGRSIDLYTERDGRRIPMRNESTGILKLISVTQALSVYCKSENLFLAIDEFDAGIYELLLGNLLEMLNEEGKGQLFITSHNLIPLERLDKKNIYFTTTNPSNRYMRLANVKPNHNLRDFYLRAAELGGQKEMLYSSDDMLSLKILLRNLAGQSEGG